MPAVSGVQTCGGMRILSGHANLVQRSRVSDAHCELCLSLEALCGDRASDVQTHGEMRIWIWWCPPQRLCMSGTQTCGASLPSNPLQGSCMSDGQNMWGDRVTCKFSGVEVSMRKSFRVKNYACKSALCKGFSAHFFFSLSLSLVLSVKASLCKSFCKSFCVCTGLTSLYFSVCWLLSKSFCVQQRLCKSFCV